MVLTAHPLAESDKSENLLSNSLPERLPVAESRQTTAAFI